MTTRREFIAGLAAVPVVAGLPPAEPPLFSGAHSGNAISMLTTTEFSEYRLFSGVTPIVHLDFGNTGMLADGMTVIEDGRIIRHA